MQYFPYFIMIISSTNVNPKQLLSPSKGRIPSGSRKIRMLAPVDFSFISFIFLIFEITVEESREKRFCFSLIDPIDSIFCRLRIPHKWWKFLWLRARSVRFYRDEFKDRENICTVDTLHEYIYRECYEEIRELDNNTCKLIKKIKVFVLGFGLDFFRSIDLRDSGERNLFLRRISLVLNVKMKFEHILDCSEFHSKTKVK